MWVLEGFRLGQPLLEQTIGGGMSNEKSDVKVYEQAASVAITLEEAAAALNNWVATMQKGSAEAVLALYDESPSFWGTMANQLATTPQSTLTYFQHFLAGKNNLQVAIDTRFSQSVGPVCLISGSYTFRFTDDNGEKQTVPARYSFGFMKEGKGEVLIISHHSSQFPAL